MNRDVKNYILSRYYFSESGIKPSQLGARRLDDGTFKVTIGQASAYADTPKDAFELAYLKHKGYFVPRDAVKPRANNYYNPLQQTKQYKKALDDGLNPMIVQTYKGVVHVGHVFYFGTPGAAFKQAYDIYKNNCKEAYGL